MQAELLYGLRPCQSGPRSCGEGCSHTVGRRLEPDCATLHLRCERPPSAPSEVCRKLRPLRLLAPP
eukprot:3814570-Alexandrium_andersonii.AAC.1